ncbi:MAG: hypothetical protein ACLVBP_15560 [Ruminococcus sp.]
MEINTKRQSRIIRFWQNPNPTWQRKWDLLFKLSKNFKALTEMIPELEDLVDTGIVTNTTALSLIRPILINHFSLKK